MENRRRPQFLENGIGAKTLHVVGDYEFDRFIGFTDAGEVTYLLDVQADIYEFCLFCSDYLLI